MLMHILFCNYSENLILELPDLLNNIKFANSKSFKKPANKGVKVYISFCKNLTKTNF